MRKRNLKLISILLSAGMVLTTVPVFADNTESAGPSVVEESAGSENPTSSDSQNTAESPAAGSAESTPDENQKNEKAAGSREDGTSSTDEQKNVSDNKIQSKDSADTNGTDSENTNAADTDSGTDSTDSPAAIDNSTDIAAGTYAPDKFTFSGGTGKAKITCPVVTVKDGKAYAKIVFSSKYYIQLKVGNTAYQAKSGSKYSGSVFEVPVVLNQDFVITGTTTAMSEAHDVDYTVHISMTSSSSRTTDKDADNGNSGNNTNTGGKTDPSSNTDTPDQPNNNKKNTETPVRKTKLKAGYIYRVTSNTDKFMFYLIQYDKNGNILPDATKEDVGFRYSYVKVKKDGTMIATITLHGQGYDYVFMGTPQQAAKANKSTWFKANIKNGYYTYTFPITALDQDLVISGHSRKLNKWYQHSIIFNSKGAQRLKNGEKIKIPKKKTSTANSGNNSGNGSGTNTTSGKQTTFTNDRKADKVSKYTDDSSKSTHAVNSSTGLKNGVYTPSAFSWSGGSGRLSYIRCNKITVRGGKAYATIEFGSKDYDKLRASGHVYSKSGSGNSTFVIPVKLNANNTIIGRTTAMSQPHWVKYQIYVGLAAAGGSKGKVAAAKTTTSSTKITKKAPTITGLSYKSQTKVSKAKYFKIFNYDNGIKLIEVDITKDTGLAKRYKKLAEKRAKNTKDQVEYDEEGKPIAKTQAEITQELYQSPVVNYLIVPKGVEIPAGLDKNVIIIRQKVKNIESCSNASLDYAEQMDRISRIRTVGIQKKNIKAQSVRDAVKDKDIDLVGTVNHMDYRTIVKDKTDLVILPAWTLPDKLEKKDDDGKKLSEKKIKEQKAEIREMRENLETVESRFSALDVPVFIDRSVNEKTKLAKAEWIKVYGAIYGCPAKADKIYKKTVKKIKKAQKAEKKAESSSKTS